jgi:hypothetical protein
MLNYQLSQKLKLIGRGKFNHLTITLTLILTCGLKLLFNRLGPTREIFNLNGGELTKLRFDPMTFGSDTMLEMGLGVDFRSCQVMNIRLYIVILT